MTDRPKTLVRRAAWGATLALLAFAAAPATAQTLRWTSQGDALTLDPHAWNEGATVAMTGMIYEALVTRDPALDLEAELATSWEQVEGGWRFDLREGVTFHGGETFDAEDVKFSFDRARGPTSAQAPQLRGVTGVEIVYPFTVIVHTDGPNPLLPEQLASVFIMDKGWAEAHDLAAPPDPAAPPAANTTSESHAVRHANGTGPYILISREPDAATELARNADWWGWDDFPGNVATIIFRAIPDGEARVAALISGEVDLVLDPPLRDLEKLKAEPGLKVSTVFEMRSIFLGMNQGAEELDSSDVKGRNPFADVRVREAMNLAVDGKTLQRVVMEGRSFPTGMIVPPGVLGNTPDNDAPYPFDLERAAALMTEAGYPDGFSVRLDCPNDRYNNDAEICRAVVGMLARIGVRAELDARPKAVHFARIQTRETDFYMLGWGVPTLDSHDALAQLVAGDGAWNATGYDNAQLDALIARIGTEADIPERTAAIMEAWDVVKKEMPYIPLHHQVIAWAMSKKVEAPIAADDALRPRLVVMSEE